jgi:hypothetical protein
VTWRITFEVNGEPVHTFDGRTAETDFETEEEADALIAEKQGLLFGVAFTLEKSEV